jgi:hypothetical protein
MTPRHYLLAACCFVCLGGSATAALDGEAKKPYQLTVVLHVADNRLLTDVFRDRVERELRDGLQAALGELAEVKVVREHPKLAEVLEKGLRSLDGWRERSEVKTHFVLIDFSGISYELQARQYDGMTGFATPVVRRENTQDREFVARTAALMIERDFGAIATFQAWPKEKAKPQQVHLELKGGGLDGPMNRWVQKGDVFAVVQMPTGTGAGWRVPDAIVQIETPPQPLRRDAVCTGNLFWRREMSSGAGVAGYRCVKLGAVRGPLQVRLVQVKPDGSPGELPPGPRLYVRRHGFTGPEDLQLSSGGKAHGSYDTSRVPPERSQFDRVAFVTVVFDRKPRAEIPIVLLDDQPVVVSVTLLDENDTLLADSAKKAWKLSVYDSYQVQSNVFTELLKKSEKKAPRAELIELAKEAQTRSAEDRQRLMEERERAYNGNLSDADQRDLAQANQRLKAIQDGERELEEYIKKQEAIDKVESRPEQKQWEEQIVRAQLLEKELEYGKAIAIYSGLLEQPGDFKDRKDVEEHLKKLRQLWEPKSEKHREARAFIYNTWPTLDTAALPKQMATAQAALKTCREAGDIISPQKLYLGIQIHATRLLQESKGLNQINIEEAEQLKVIKEIAAHLTQLEADIKAYLDQARK